MSQEKETSGSDLWQINVLCDVESSSTLALIVTKNCYTRELFEKLRLHPKFPQTDDFQLFYNGGNVRRSLVESWEERLSDYDIADRSTLALVANLTGGVWPTAKEVEAEPRHLKPGDGITLTTISAEHPDVFCLEYDGPGVIMQCGHATAPTPLAQYCLMAFESGKDEIRCPKCDVKWKFALIKHAACLTLNEITEFEKRAHINYFRNHQSEMNTCPRCGTFSRPRRAKDKRVICLNCTSRSGKTFEFCWTCLGDWKTSGDKTCGNPDCGSNKRLLEILTNCETKQLKGVEVPSKRACPNCSIIIDHKTGCKHMTCRCCRYEFCFICLKKYPCETDVFEPCDVAPCQTSDTMYIVSSVDTEKKLYSEDDSDLQRAEDSIDTHSNLNSASQDDVMALENAIVEIIAAFIATLVVGGLGVLGVIDVNALSSDDITVSTNSVISSRPDDVTLSTNNDAVSNMTISASENTVKAGNTAIDNTLTRNYTEGRPNPGRGGAHANSVNDGNVARLQQSNSIQPNKTQETTKAFSSTSAATSGPANMSRSRRNCSIQ